MDEAREALTRLRDDPEAAFQTLERSVWDLIESTAAEQRPFVLLASLKGVDARMWRHALNVCLYAIHFGRALGLDGSTLHDLAVGALLHDVGYLELPGPVADLAPDERRRHPQLGAAYLAGLPEVPALPVLVAYQHHVHWDGSGGYPETGARPNLASQITAVVDAWDMLLAAPGPPARAFRASRAASYLEDAAGRSLNPELVRIFLDLMGGTDDAP